MIAFYPAICGPQGGWVPLNLDGTRHNHVTGGPITIQQHLQPPQQQHHDCDTLKIDLLLQEIVGNKVELVEIKNMLQDFFMQRRKQAVGSVRG